MKRNKPSNTGVGISVSGVGNISKDNAIRRLDSRPVNLVSLTFTMLKMQPNTKNKLYLSNVETNLVSWNNYCKII